MPRAECYWIAMRWQPKPGSSARRGAEAAKDSAPSNCRMNESTRKMLRDAVVVQDSRRASSYADPRKANGAIKAPIDMPVTILKAGRLPVFVQPFRNPPRKHRSRLE